jgi:hypothetical protein
MWRAHQALKNLIALETAEILYNLLNRLSAVLPDRRRGRPFGDEINLYISHADGTNS